MQERKVCNGCKVPQLCGIRMVSGAATMELTDGYLVSGSPSLLRKGMDWYSLFHNSVTMLSYIVEKPEFECPDCSYIEKLNNMSEEEE